VVKDHQTPYSPGPSSPLRGSRCDQTCLNATPWAKESLFRAHVVWFGTKTVHIACNVTTHLHITNWRKTLPPLSLFDNPPPPNTHTHTHIQVIYSYKIKLPFPHQHDKSYCSIAYHAVWNLFSVSNH
jgi:hypothetical protein